MSQAPDVLRPTRRAFVQAVGMVSLGLLAGCGRLPWQGQQPAKVPRIGYLSPFSPQHPFSEAFRDGLREQGYVEGENIAVEYRCRPPENGIILAYSAHSLMLVRATPT